MKGKVLLGVLGLLVAFRGEAETKPQATQKEAQEAWRLKNHTPEEMEAWRKIESVLHPGSGVVLWEPLTEAEIQKRERESRQLREAAREAQEHLATIQAGRIVDRTFDYANKVLDRISEAGKEFTAKIEKSEAREVAEAAARKEVDDKAWYEKMAQIVREGGFCKKENYDRRWAAWCLDSLDSSKYVAFNHGIAELRKREDKPLPGYLVNAGKGSKTVQLAIVYQVPLTLSLNVVGSRDIDFSEVWKDIVPRKTVTLRGSTNAPGRTTLYGYFAGDVAGLSNGTVVIPCAAVTEQANVPLTLTPQEIGTIEKEAVDIPLSLTLEKKEGLVPGRYTGTIVFELVGP